MTREAGSFKLKGKTHAVVVHELMGRVKECAPKQRDACAIVAEALQAFQHQSWEEAQAKFQRCIESLGEDKLSRFYLELCARYKQKPPEEPWEGIIPMDEK